MAYSGRGSLGLTRSSSGITVKGASRMKHIPFDSMKTCVFCVARYSDMVFVADSCLQLIRLLILIQLYRPRVDKSEIEGVISDWRN